MYIWVVLATFIVAIYSFNLSHRADMKELLILPQAEALISKMVAQHNAGRRYVDANEPRNSGQTVITYYPGELRPNIELKKYLPYGYVNNMQTGDFRTLIYCLDKNDSHLSSVAAGCGNNMISCCSDPNSVAYLVTFGCIPRKWRNVRTGQPKAEFFKALHKIGVDGTELGYTEVLSSEEKNDERNVYRSDIAVRARNISLISIPQYIVNNSLSGADVSFSDMCGVGKGDTSDTCSHCLMYLTPVSF